VGITNAFNLLDNMDGLSAGVAAVATGVLLLNALSLGEMLISLILAAFLGSLLGFLFFNFHPATVFLGDCGSLFIGFVMASLTLLERYVSHASGSLFPVLMPVVVLAVPIVDTATVVVIRLREGRPIYVGDTRHLSHRLAALGFSQRAVALFIYLATLCLGLGAVNLSDATPGQALIILVQSVGFVALLLILLFVERQAATAGSAQ
jgi:UDP-GlcNAc:undecaprenyl-phosphate GlcNAc-1-phosphate transferase